MPTASRISFYGREASHCFHGGSSPVHAVSSGNRANAPPVKSSVPALTQPIDRHCGDDDSTNDDLLHGVIDSRERATSTQATEHEGSDHGAEDATFAAGKARATDHHRGDDLKFETDRGRWITDSQPTERDGAGKPGAETTQDVDEDLGPRHRHPAQSCCRFT